MSIEGISDALAFKAESPAGAYFVLWYVSAGKIKVSEESIKAYLIAKLPPYMLPSVIKKVDTIAYSNNGKKIRDINELSLQSYDSLDQDNVHDIVHKVIKKIIHKIVGSSVQEDNLFDNLNSLEYITLLVELEEALGLEFDDGNLNMSTFSSSSEFADYVVELIESKEQAL